MNKEKTPTLTYLAYRACSSRTHKQVSRPDEYGFDLPVDARIRASAFQQQVVGVYVHRW